MFPVFARARENARRASCQSNLKQIGLGITQYTQDYDEKLPFRCAFNYAGGEAISWRRVIYPYVKSTQVFACSSNPFNSGTQYYNLDSQDDAMTSAGLSLTNSPRFNISYGVNGLDNMSGAGGGTSPMPNGIGRSLVALPAVAQTIMATEETRVTSEAVFTDAGSMFKGHLGTVNFLFCDGHVKALKPTATGTPINMWNIEENVGDADSSLMNALSNWQTKVNAG